MVFVHTEAHPLLCLSDAVKRQPQNAPTEPSARICRPSLGVYLSAVLMH